MANQPTAGAHWRDSARPAKLFFIDASAAFPLLLFLVHIEIWTFILAVLFVVFFTILNRYGYNLRVFLRIARGFFAGSRKVVVPWWRN